MIVKIRNIIIFLFLVTGISCQDVKKTEKPEDLIPEGKMIDVLTELSLVHAARNYNKFKLEGTGIDPDNYIYEKFNIDSLQFERSNNYYAEQYTQYERIYDSVKARLQIMKTRLDSVREAEVRIEDSLKQVKKDSLKRLDSLGVEIDSIIPSSEEMDESTADSLIPPPNFRRLDSID